MLKLEDGETWWKEKILPHKHIIAAYGAAIAGLPSQIAYNGWQKTVTVVFALPSNNTKFYWYLILLLHSLIILPRLISYYCILLEN